MTYSKPGTVEDRPRVLITPMSANDRDELSLTPIVYSTVRDWRGAALLAVHYPVNDNGDQVIVAVDNRFKARMATLWADADLPGRFDAYHFEWSPEVEGRDILAADLEVFVEQAPRDAYRWSRSIGAGLTFVGAA